MWSRRLRSRGCRSPALRGAPDSRATAAALGHGGGAGTCARSQAPAARPSAAVRSRGAAVPAAGWLERRGGGSVALPPTHPTPPVLLPSRGGPTEPRGLSLCGKGSRAQPAFSQLQGQRLAPALHHLETGLSRFSACSETGLCPGRGCQSQLAASVRCPHGACPEPELFSLPSVEPYGLLRLNFLNPFWGDVQVSAHVRFMSQRRNSNSCLIW